MRDRVRDKLRGARPATSADAVIGTSRMGRIMRTSTREALADGLLAACVVFGPVVVGLLVWLALGQPPT